MCLMRWIITFCLCSRLISQTKIFVFTPLVLVRGCSHGGNCGGGGGSGNGGSGVEEAAPIRGARARGRRVVMVVGQAMAAAMLAVVAAPMATVAVAVVVAVVAVVPVAVAAAVVVKVVVVIPTPLQVMR